MTSDLGATLGPDVWVEVVMTLEAVHSEGSFRLSKVRERAPIPATLFCLWKQHKTYYWPYTVVRILCYAVFDFTVFILTLLHVENQYQCVFDAQIQVKIWIC